MVRYGKRGGWRRNLGIVFVVTILGLWVVCCNRPERQRTPTAGIAAEADMPGVPGSGAPEGQDLADSHDGPPARSPRRHPAFAQRAKERLQMVTYQVQARGIQDRAAGTASEVLEAMRTVPRHAFVPAPYRGEAYADYPLPIGHGQTISQPYIVAFMTETLHLDPNSKVLEIGTGSGYQAAVCAEIAREVYTIEIVPELAQAAAQTLKELGYTNVHVRAADGFFGWPEQAPFDAIIGTAAAGQIPPPLLEQLKPRGRMILPCEDADGLQYLVLITRDQRGKLSQEQVLPVRFVPMTGQVQKPQTK